MSLTLRLRALFLILAVAAFTVASALVAVPSAQAAGFSFYQGSGGSNQAVTAWMADGSTRRIAPGTSLPSGVIQVGSTYYAEIVFDQGQRKCALPGQRITIRGTGASGYAALRCP